jgi:hypothetical protein
MNAVGVPVVIVGQVVRRSRIMISGTSATLQIGWTWAAEMAGEGPLRLRRQMLVGEEQHHRSWGPVMR